MDTLIEAVIRGDREVFPPYLYEAYQSTRRRAPHQPLIETPLTISELTGPGPYLSRVIPEDADLTRNSGTLTLKYNEYNCNEFSFHCASAPSPCES